MLEEKGREKGMMTEIWKGTARREKEEVHRLSIIIFKDTRNSEDEDEEETEQVKDELRKNIRHKINPRKKKEKKLNRQWGYRKVVEGRENERER